jgi:hypothetical protein
MDERTERLLNKAEQAIDRSETDNAEAYRILASQAFYMKRKDSRDTDRKFHRITQEQVND